MTDRFCPADLPAQLVFLRLLITMMNMEERPTLPGALLRTKHELIHRMQSYLHLLEKHVEELHVIEEADDKIIRVHLTRRHLFDMLGEVYNVLGADFPMLSDSAEAAFYAAWRRGEKAEDLTQTLLSPLNGPRERLSPEQYNAMCGWFEMFTGKPL